MVSPGTSFSRFLIVAAWHFNSQTQGPWKPSFPPPRVNYEYAKRQLDNLSHALSGTSTTALRTVLVHRLSGPLSRGQARRLCRRIFRFHEAHRATTDL